MQVEFAIQAWAGLAAGLVSPSCWLRWAKAPECPAGEFAPASAPLAEVPAMLRRRLGPLGKYASQVAYDCQGDDDHLPFVFASRYGDSTRSLNLLGDYSNGSPISPADFALSVHNAISAIYSIARKDRGFQSSIAGGRFSAEAGLVEAVSLLDDGAQAVMLVHYDEPLPGEYAAFSDEPSSAYAWAWRVSRPAHAAESFTLRACSPELHDPLEKVRLPHGLDVFRFVLSGAPSLKSSDGQSAWTWTRHD
ncbi:beta-ketoacyl synthase chain length factor [Xylophilus sp. GOD-11R]|uniref:beta-ketoacyl synthase chain length factor n=1 Tax=Xylophilus sp. GOD-11R TaxID=3089814 RepID=UPI00298D03E2|nr:beta-ketoacyl synthase chain length factor [Xylophilus sp. GOD-11R]WPB57069.1 beta-ketoacyl synthase chain length factor [Xylophilus sp. GOD-11R]